MSYANLTIAGILLGSTAVFYKLLLGKMPVYLFLALQFFIGVLICSFIYLFRILKITTNNKRLQQRDYLLLLAQAFASAIGNIFLLNGVNLSTATMQGLLTSTSPAFTTVLAWLFLKERITRLKIFIIGFMMTGITILNFNPGVETKKYMMAGNLLIILYVVLNSFAIICVKKLPQYVSVFSMVFASCIVSFFMCALFFIFSQESFNLIFTFSVSTWTLLITCAAISTVFYGLFWNAGLVKIKANRAILFLGLNPISAMLFASIFLNEKIALIQIMGLIIILSALFLEVFNKE